MRDRTKSQYAPVEREELRQRLLAEWYNYENKDSPLTGAELNHWIEKLRDCLELDGCESKAATPQEEY